MHGAVEVRPRGQLVAATDAGYSKKHEGGYAYVTSDGRWGLRHWLGRSYLDPSGPSAVLVLELRAVAYLLETRSAPPELLLSDSATAIRYLQAWQRGDRSWMPSGYDLRRRSGHESRLPTLVRLAETMAALPGLRIEHVRGHSGHPLNEAADALASLAMRRLPAEEARARADGIARAFVDAWYAST
jgi:ribonuclease HI